MKNPKRKHNMRQDVVGVHLPNGKIEEVPIQAVPVSNSDNDGEDPSTIMEEEILQDNAYGIADIQKAYSNIDHPKCPIIYDGEHIICSPVPHDVVLEDLHDQIYDEDYDDSWQLHIVRRQTLDALTNMYTNAARATLESFFNKNLVDFFSYTDHGVGYTVDIERRVNAMCGAVSIEYPIGRMFNRWWMTMDDKNLTLEQKNINNSNYMVLAKNEIMESLADKMSTFAREVSFGEKAEYSNDYVDKDQRMNYQRSIARQFEDDSPAQTVYITISMALTSMINAIDPMIEILLWQAVNTFNYVYFETTSDQYSEFTDE